MDEFRIRLSGKHCVYCGMRAQTDDHFPPRCYTHKGFLFPSCGECNMLAGTEHPTNLEKRIAHVKQRIASRHRKALRVPIWSEDDLSELSPEMEKEIRAWQEKRRIAHGRLVWNAAVYIWSIVPDSDSARMLAGLGITIRSAA